jgi:CelD/BcsL family acetyltransferase involved in cellulose biosynthesis
MTWQFEWITDWDRVWSEDFVSRWHRWIQESPTSHVFFHPAVVRAWVETYLPLRHMEPRFLVATREDCTVFLPMVLWRKNWKNAFQRLLIPVGYSDHDYHDPLIVGRNDKEIWRDYWEGFVAEVGRTRREEYDRVDLSGIHETVACFDAFVDQGVVCPWRDLRGFKDGDAFLASLSKKLRGDIRRHERQIRELGEITWRVFASEDVDIAEQAVLEFRAVHTERWPRAYKAPRVFRNLIHYGLPVGVVYFSILQAGGSTMAWRLGFLDQRRFYAYMQAQRPQYAAFSPSKVLLYYTVKDAIARGLQVFDHLLGDESYKTGWADHADRLSALYRADNSLGSVLRNASADRLKPVISKLLRV